MIASMTVAELYEGAYRANWGTKGFQRIHQVLDRYPVLEPTVTVCQLWGQIRSERKRRPISGEDAWIAATAVAYKCPLITHDPDDFEEIPGLEIITELKS